MAKTTPVLPTLLVIAIEHTSKFSSVHTLRFLEAFKFVMGKRKIVTLSDKQDIIKRIDGGASQAAIAREYGIGRSTVNEIYKFQRSKIAEFLTSS